jgi:hypothetical protein
MDAEIPAQLPDLASPAIDGDELRVHRVAFATDAEIVVAPPAVLSVAGDATKLVISGVDAAATVSRIVRELTPLTPPALSRKV